MKPFFPFRKATKKQPEEMNRDLEQEQLDFNLFIEMVKQKFSYPLNQDFVIREMRVKSLQKDAAIFYLESMADVKSVEENIIRPLIEEKVDEKTFATSLDLIESLLTSHQLNEMKKYGDIIDEINDGNTILIIKGISLCISIGTTGFAHRSIERTQDENLIRGPKEAFIESSQVNLSLIRKQVRDENLITEGLTVGKRSKSKVKLLYIRDLTNEDLIQNVRDRIAHIDTDSVPDLETLEEYIEENTFSLVPSVLFTERPDRASAFLQEGHVVMIMDNSPSAMIVPVTIWSLFHTSEDYYLRWFYGNFVRLIRIIALFITSFTPAIYIAITNYHSEMIPPDLLLAVASTREMVPFPAILEVLLMEITFEILREAGIRIPNPIGPTIGIVGALILGQAAVDANIVSPILVIVVALTGLASFAIPNVSFNYMMRILRFLFTLSAAFMGMYGLMASLMIFTGYLASLQSFGVPFLSPVSPYFRSSRDTYFRFPLWFNSLRPSFLKTKDPYKRNKRR